MAATKPGGGGGGSPPANYAYLTDERLFASPQTSRMPTTQREWSAFIVELNKWIKNETGAFDIGGSATAQFVGFSTDPSTASVWWHRYGQIVLMEFWFTTGNSDTNTFQITGVPEIIRPRDNMTCAVLGLLDNGIAITEPGVVEVGSNGVLDFKKTISGAGWTAGDTLKGPTISGRSSIIYSLRQPGKL